MSGNTILLSNYDSYVSSNYGQLKDSAKTIYWKNEYYEDSLHDILLKARTRIEKSGFTSNNYGGYLYITTHNTHIKSQKKNKRRHFVDYSNPDLEYEINESMDDMGYSNQFYKNDLEIVAHHLYEYVDKYYPQHISSIFKSYYKTSSNTYEKLIQNCNFSLKYIKNTMSKIKRDIRTNLINYAQFEQQEEVWRPVKNYEDLYLISNKGNVKSIRTGKIMKKNDKGHVRLNRNKVRKYKSIEQLQEGVFKEKDCLTFKRVI